ncbi:MAG: RecQ family ATP-dependent DNA helicase, partial [Woeseiaceae bacterium]
ANSFNRPNIRYSVMEKRQPKRQLLRFLATQAGESGIVYALSRKRVEEISGYLRDEGYAAAPYHAGLPGDVRRDVQERFLRDEVAIVVATVAFGMGIDKPNVRFVVHFDLPRHIEGYYQETGRAGRDGLASEALLLSGAQDIVMARTMIESTANEQRRRIESHKLQSMVAFAESLTCRRRVLLGYFGESLEQDCGNCDVCLDPPERFDASEDARKAMSCVYRVGQRFGIRHVVDVLRGAETQRIRRLHHDRLSTYAIGADRSDAEWTSIIRQLIHRGYLMQDVGNYSVLKLTDRARPLLRGEEGIELARPRVGPASAPKAAAKPQVQRATRDLAPADRELFNSLRDLRKRLAMEQGVPPYVIFGDVSLLEMSQRRPATESEFLEITGVGQVKLQRHGALFMEAIAGV